MEDGTTSFRRLPFVQPPLLFNAGVGCSKKKVEKKYMYFIVTTIVAKSYIFSIITNLCDRVLCGRNDLKDGTDRIN